jgi:hypothetical protein
MLRWAIGLLCLLAPIGALAQTPARHGTPSLTALVGGVRDKANVRDLAIDRLEIAIQLRGGIAETMVTARFANRGTEQLEGDFRLTLPADAVVTGYALDVKERMIDGVLVDQPKAKAVYEAAVRGRVDPGLAEVDPEGTFRTRVFPIPAKGSRTIRVRYVAPLFNSHRGEDVYVLPLDIAAPRGGWSISVRATGVTAAPSLTWPGRGPIEMARDGDGFAARGEGTQGLEGLLILGRPALPEALVSRNGLGERFVQLSGPLPARGADTADRVRIYWDRSRARLGEREGELALLRRALAGLKARVIEVVTFNSSGAERKSVANGDAAIALLRGVRYRGATSFAAIGKDRQGADRCLLFSEGRPAIDRDAAIELPCRLDAVAATRTADLAWLRHLAAAHGGRAHRLGDDIGAIEKALVQAAPGVTAVLDDAGRRLPFVPIESGAGQWLIAARAPERGGVRVMVGGSEVRRALPDAAAFDGEGVLLAADTLATMGGTERRAAYVALSRRYGVASPSLSFLVLETPEDYVRADVDPPASYPGEELAAWRKLRDDAAKEKTAEQEAQLGKVAAAWAEQVEWWQRRFTSRQPKRQREEEDEVVMSSPVYTPPPEPAPAPALRTAPGVQADGFGAESSDDEIIATGTRISASPDGPRIEIEAWQPDRPYLKAFDAAPARFDALFAQEEKTHGHLPAFYFDTAEWLRRHGRAGDAAEMVLAALDLPIADAVTHGIVADRLERYGALDRAVELRERQAAFDTSRPQPKRLLALALARRAAKRPAGARADLERAVALLSEVALTPWDGRWQGVELIALMEANALIPKLRALGGETSLDRRLIALLDADIRVVADWNTDATDLDLWVDEPGGERAIYSHQRTAIGGHLSNDMTQGYGPEEYFLRRAPGGTYTVRADVFASDRIDPNGPSIVTVHLIRDFGRPTEREEAVDIEVLGGDGDEKLVGRIVVTPRR